MQVELLVWHLGDKDNSAKQTNTACAYRHLTWEVSYLQVSGRLSFSIPQNV